MPIWGWVCVGLTVAFIALIAYGAVRDSIDQNRILREGVPVVAYIVQANSSLFQPGGMDSPAQALITFDETIPEVDAFLEDLAGRVAALKGEFPDDPVGRQVAVLVNDEAYRPHTRHLLPAEFTEGREVYSVHIWIVRRYLPGGKLTRTFVLARAIEGEPSSRVIMIPYSDHG
jgi:hypothetical protein